MKGRRKTPGRTLVTALAIAAGTAALTAATALMPSLGSRNTTPPPVRVEQSEAVHQASPASPPVQLEMGNRPLITNVTAPETAADAAPAAVEKALTSELAQWKTRHPAKLVHVLRTTVDQQNSPIPLNYLLAIAWTETRGKVLAISPAGAAGLAQATPAAYLSEGGNGKLYVTNAYLIGTRAYIMKKPLNDADRIASMLIRRNDAKTRRNAKRLLASAQKLRRVGMGELEALRPVANDVFYRHITAADAHNREALAELGRLIDHRASRRSLIRYRNRIRRDYRYLRNLQRAGWSKYQRQLTSRRDAILRQHYHAKPDTIIQQHPYEAGEYLGKVLDVRFSPQAMAAFLSQHLTTKQQEATRLGVPHSGLDEWTAALYNAGEVNITRLRAGLIRSLSETTHYMKRVPARAAVLAKVISAADAAS
ncbi:MAG: hypothetical protein WBX15_13765 [Thermoanaerobaculia bacterium]